MRKDNSKIFFDTNIIIDILENRLNKYLDSNLYPKFIKNYKGYICSKQITDIFYILRKQFKDEKIRKDIIKYLITKFKIINFRRKDIEKGLEINGKDFEDDLLYAVALRSKMNYLLTNNKKDFIQEEDLKVISPIELMNL